MEEITPPMLKRNFGSGDLTKYSKAYEEGKRKAYENCNSIDYISDISSLSHMYEGGTNISYPFFQMDSFSDHVSNDNETNKFTFSESSYEKNVSSDCMTVDEKMGFLSISPSTKSPFSQKRNKSYEKFDPLTKNTKTIVRKSNNNNKK